ncbi:hypothetical protein IGI04_037142 [Brassica rapa subsp. trilocularis]|uniref:Uncharacterized protein n=1 Tax=Brassica rapa subsp. trilocularis TaxID=1813537 RepID=A0ABQ7LGJ0_BRACM|nr:hypothetical protein IGI04_037142 [Brassica rapa subsp. trilocularis]
MTTSFPFFFSPSQERETRETSQRIDSRLLLRGFRFELLIVISFVGVVSIFSNKHSVRLLRRTNPFLEKLLGSSNIYNI